MISPFLKKLLFARQFSIMDGNIEILGKKQVLLPGDVIYLLEKNNPKFVYTLVKNAIKNDIRDYSRKLGSSDEGMLNILHDIYETFGLGNLQIIDLDNKKRRCILRVHNSPLMEIRNGKNSVLLTPAILSGMFSFLFGKDVDAKKIKSRLTGLDYYEYIVS